MTGEKCICKICTCGKHKCGGGGVILSDVLGQNFMTRAPYPKTEAQTEYREHPYAPQDNDFKPLAADWYYRIPTWHCICNQRRPERAPCPMPEDFSDTGYYEKEDVMPEVEKPKPVTEGTEDILGQSPPFNLRTFEVPDYNGPFIPTRLPLPTLRGELELPPLQKTSVYRDTYQVPLPMSQLPSCGLSTKEGYCAPSVPFENKTTYMRDFVVRDTSGGLRAPLPSECECGRRICTDNISIYNVPFHYLTTTREAYGAPPFDISRVKFSLEDKCSGTPDFMQPCCRGYVCERHRSPAEQFAMSRIFLSTHQKDYTPPKLPSRKKSTKCPAADLVDDVDSSPTFQYMGTCFGHKLFKERPAEKEA